MTGLVATVRGKLDEACVRSRRLRKEGCSVSLRDAPQPRLIIDLDKPGSPLSQNQTRCDYLFVAEVPSKRDWVVPLELKSGGLDAGKVVEQLQAGARAAEKLVQPSRTIRLCPVLAYGGSMHRAERTVMKQKSSWVRFHDYSEPVRQIRCGSPLTQALRA